MTITDNKDTGLTATVTYTKGGASVDGVNTSVAGTYLIHYNVCDAAGNDATEVTRTVIAKALDTVAPVITLKGDKVTTITVYGTYTDAGAIATDDIDGTVIVTDDSATALDTTKAETYTITYTAKDAAGNTATVTRTVTVTTTLFDDRIQVSNTTNNLAGGVKEHIIVSNNGYNWQNTSYFSEVNLASNSNIKIMSCYGAYDANKWKMTTISNQAAAAQSYFDKTEGYENYKIVGILNGDAYDMSTGVPLGALVMNGIKYHNAGSTPYFAILKDGTAAIRDSSAPLDDCVSAVGGFEIIVKDGVIKPGLNSSLGTMSSRTSVGIKEDGTVVTMVTHGFTIPKSYGLTIYEVAEYMKSMGCVDVLNLDGGGSAEWCSMYEGTNKLIVRNTPSDGYERHVSSSILIVSTATGDGEFDHATITPAMSVYTPNSTVAFTATGVDKVGSAADIPEGAALKLVDNSYGSINTAGIFVSNGKTGDVKVQLCYDNNVVGTSTIMIKAPDSIKFVSPEISIGRGKESNLGIALSYQGRTVNYNAGDLIWSLSNNDMGTVNTKTDTFTASPDLTMTGTITIISKYDPLVCGSVVVNVGQDPTVAMNFEDYTETDETVTDAYTYWGADNSGKIVGQANFAVNGGNIIYLTPATGMITTGDYNRGGKECAEIVSRANGYPVHLGTNALKINYDMSAATGTEGANVGLTKDYLIPGNPTAIGLWVYVPDNTPNLWLRVRLSIVDANGNTTATTQFNFTEECKGAFTTKGTYGGLSDVEPGSWKFLSANLSAYAGSKCKMPAGETIRIMWTKGSLITSAYNSRLDVTNSSGIYLSNGTTISQDECVGSIYVDDLMFIYGSINEDAKSPTVTSFTANGGQMSDGMVFNTGNISFQAMFNDEYDADNMVKASGIDKNNVYMYVDGQSMENAVVDNEGMIKLDGVYLANGEHSVKLLVCDTNGNEKILTYRFIVNAANSTATTVKLVAKQTEAVLGKSVDLDVVSSQMLNLDAMTMALQIDSKYQDRYTITAVNDFTIDQNSIAYDKVHNTVTFTANRNVGSISNGSGAIATISFAIPTTIAEGSYFNYRVTAGKLKYDSNYSNGNQPSFSSLNYQIPVEAAYIITSDVIVSGMSGSYFYVKDANGAAVPNLKIYFSDDRTIGTTDSDGKVAVPASIDSEATAFTIYAKDGKGNVSFNYSGQSYAAGGAADGSPVYILNNAASNGYTARNLTWMSNPVYSKAAAKLQISDSEVSIGSGTIYSGTSKLLTFTGSASASENHAARINGVMISELTLGAKYFYRVGDGVTWSTVDSFIIPNADSETNMFVLGDVQAEDLTNIKTILTTLQQGGVNYDLGIQTGDAVELASLYSDWTKSLNLMNSLKNNQVILHTLGNHELTGESGQEIASAIYNLGNPSYYSVNYGSVYVATISYMSSMSDYKKALEWLVQDASKSNAPHKILVMHQPAYYTNVTDPSNAELHELLPAYAEQAGIDMVFSGHDHSYARTEEINGVVYYICGSSGEKAYPVTDNENFHFAKVTGDFTATYLTVNATNEAMTVTTYDLVNGVSTVIDTYTKFN